MNIIWETEAKIKFEITIITFKHQYKYLNINLFLSITMLSSALIPIFNLKPKIIKLYLQFSR